MRSGTQDKLSEAKYFLQCTEECLMDADRFRWNLSAFLSAARSIVMIMTVEYSSSEGYKDWLRSRMAASDIKTKGLMNYMTEQRNLTIHVRPLKASGHIKIELQETFQLNAQVNLPLVITGTGSTTKLMPVPDKSRLTMPEEASRGAIVEKKYCFEDIKDRDVVSVCKTYLEEIQNIVDECVARFV